RRSTGIIFPGEAHASIPCSALHNFITISPQGFLNCLVLYLLGWARLALPFESCFDNFSLHGLSCITNFGLIDALLTAI
ncbi:hypothetical protein ACJX0J_025384, partial [Zea mays]